MDTYNLLDFLAVAMFLTAFGLKANTPYACIHSPEDQLCNLADQGVDMNLNHFG